MQGNLPIETLTANNSQADTRVPLIGFNNVSTTRPTNEHEVFVGFIGFAFHRCIFSSDRPLAIAA